MSKIALYCVLTLFMLRMPAVAVPPFESVVSPRDFTAPRDHGAHFQFPTEWWYFTGHARDTNANTYGFEITFFRVGITPHPRPAQTFLPGSLYVAHFAVTDDTTQTFLYAERLERDVFPELAGASSERLHIWLGGWSASMEDGSIALTAQHDGLAIDFTLRPEKPLVLHGDRGFVQKGPQRGDASLYSSFTRLVGTGVLTMPDSGPRDVQITGAWMDHEVLSSDTGPDTRGWDWFAIQLDSGTELMLYHLKNDAGAISSFSRGSVIAPDGSVTQLQPEDFSIEATTFWKSPRTNISYPAGWRVSVPRLSVDLLIKPTVAAQELVTLRSTGVQYWEGRCLVSGSAAGRPATGNAYVELVGYD